MVGGGVTKPVRLQNNIFSGIGTLSTQASTVATTNYRSIAPGFVNRSAYDLRPTPNALVVDAGTNPGMSATGVALTPVFGASPYLSSLARRRPHSLQAILDSDPSSRLDAVLAQTAAAATTRSG